MLAINKPTRVRRLAGAASIGVLAAVAGYAAWAVQPAEAIAPRAKAQPHVAVEAAPAVQSPLTMRTVVAAVAKPAVQSPLTSTKRTGVAKPAAAPAATPAPAAAMDFELEAPQASAAAVNFVTREEAQARAAAGDPVAQAVISGQAGRAGGEAQ